MIDNQVHPKAFMEELTWDQVRDDVMKVNPEFAAVVDRLSPSKEYTVFKATYPYGSEILKRGDLYVPNKEGELVSLKHHSISSHIRDSLDYNLDSNPVTLVLHNTLELFANLHDRTIPLYGLIPSGKLFGLWRIMSPNKSHQPRFIWDMTAGARSIFMLPRISEVERHKKLKKVFHVSAEAPNKLMDHWQVFREISNHSNFHEPWNSVVLFFSKKWFEHLNEYSWLDFNRYLLKTVWEGSEFWRNEFFWDLIFSIIQKIKDIKPSPYVMDTVKYLFAIGTGDLPGFAPAIDSSAAPIKGIQEAYLDVYNLKKYTPIIMQPILFDLHNRQHRPIYYSLQFPNAVELGHKFRNRSSAITDLYEVKSLINKYLRELVSGQFKVEETPLYDFIKMGTYDYFHNNVGHYHGIKENKEIPVEDDNFLFNSRNGNDEFPITSSFVQGCIRISQKK